MQMCLLCFISVLNLHSGNLRKLESIFFFGPESPLRPADNVFSNNAEIIIIIKKL